MADDYKIERVSLVSPNVQRLYVSYRGDEAQMRLIGWRKKRDGSEVEVQVTLNDLSPEDLLCVIRTATNTIAEMRDNMLERIDRMEAVL